MSHERFLSASKGEPKGVEGRGYHHGDLRNGLLEAARAILEEESLAALTLRAVARKAGVSHAAPYRHFKNRESLLAEVAAEGFLRFEATLQRQFERRLREATARGVPTVAITPENAKDLVGK